MMQYCQKMTFLKHPHDAILSENDVLQAGSVVDVFAWLT